MTADDNSFFSSYDSISATDLTVGPTKTVTDSDIDTSKLQYQRCFLPTPTNREGCAVVSHIDLHQKSPLCIQQLCQQVHDRSDFTFDFNHLFCELISSEMYHIIMMVSLCSCPSATSTSVDIS